MKQNLVKKNFIWNIIGSTFSSFNSLFFMIIVTRINGTNQAGLFTFAFSTACLFYIIGIYSGRTYQITDDDKEITDSDYFYSKIFTCIIMIVTALIFCIIRNYQTSKILIMMGLVIFKSLEAFSEGVYAIIQENNQLYKVGISLFLKAIISVLLFLIIDIITHNMMLSIISIICVNIIIILLYDFKNLRILNFKINKFNFVKLKKIIIYGFSAFAFAFLTQYVINSPKYAIDSTLSNNSQTIFGIIIMPATVMILLGQFIIQPFILNLKENLKKSKKEFLKLTLILIFLILLIGIFSSVFIYFFGIPILQLLYNINLKKYLMDLMIIIIGSTLYEITVIFSTSLITMRSTFSQLIIFVIASIFSYFVSNILVKKYLILGASYTYMLSMLLLLILYIIVFFIVLKKYKGDKK